MTFCMHNSVCVDELFPPIMKIYLKKENYKLNFKTNRSKKNKANDDLHSMP